MSWLSLSLPNPFKSQQENLSEEEGSPSHGGGVTEDLSELGKTIGRQLWGVASFLAPPPDADIYTSTASVASDSSSQTLLGIRNDFAEIGGSFKSGISLLSTNKAVNEISRLASNLLQFQKEDEGAESSGDDSRESIVGITEEVLDFVREISMKPECWIDFPFSLEDDEFDMHDVQREHVSMVERLVPSLGALRIKLCPSCLNEGHFWMIYFILLHPRLNGHDSELVSTPQIVEARDILLQKLQNRSDPQLQTSKMGNLSVEPSKTCGIIQEENSPVQEKDVMARTVNAANLEDADVDQWLEEDDETGTSFDARKQFGNEQDVSFSDLEDDDNNMPSRQLMSSAVQNMRVSSPNGSSGWVQLDENSDTGGDGKKAVQPNSREKDSEGEELNEWLTVEDFDSDSVGTV